MSVERLFERVLELEAKFGLEAGDGAYSDRLLALLDALEEEIEAGGAVEWPDEMMAPTAIEDTSDADGLGGQLAKLQAMMGESEEAVPETKSETVEEAVSTIETSLSAENGDFETYQEKVRGTNINEATLLATDYLNHFNEIVMTLEMVPMMPEILEEAKEWKPKSYQQHFLDSGFSDKELAVEAYNHVPSRFKDPFELTISQMDQLVAATIDRLEKGLAEGATELVQEAASTNSKIIQRLIDVASGIIHGSESTMDQGEIDSYLH